MKYRILLCLGLDQPIDIPLSDIHTYKKIKINLELQQINLISTHSCTST